jgi:hypothetical protein
VPRHLGGAPRGAMGVCCVVFWDTLARV